MRDKRTDQIKKRYTDYLLSNCPLTYREFIYDLLDAYLSVIEKSDKKINYHYSTITPALIKYMTGFHWNTIAKEFNLKKWNRQNKCYNEIKFIFDKN